MKNKTTARQGIRVRWNASSSRFTATTDDKRRVYHPHDYALSIADDAAKAAAKWLEKHCSYEAELVEHQFTFGNDRYFSWRITGPKKESK
tara:strand:+ start:108 stop:377 length:270 start_codon:yes stop_codon:yes gene_type:complete